jgi:hypothetical protein
MAPAPAFSRIFRLTSPRVFGSLPSWSPGEAGIVTNSRRHHFIVIGGGPAGAMAAEKLARAGWRVSVFEEKLGWEKPCGGGVTPKALARYPFLSRGAEGS